MKSTHLLPVLAALLPTLASASPVYNIWAGTPASVTALGVTYAASSAEAKASWDSATTNASAYARATTSAGVYEFQLVSVTATYPAYRFDGYWNVSRNGVLLCSKCPGYTDSISSGPGKPFTIYVDGSNYKITTTITSTQNH